MKSSLFNHSGGETGLEGDEYGNETRDEGIEMKSRATLCLAIVYVFICVIGFTANAAVLLMIARSRRSKAVTNIYIFNLALADLLYAICLPAAIYQMLNGQWTIGHMTCKLYYTCDGVSKFASVMFLVILSFDRYMAVCYPIRCLAARTARVAFITTGMAWTIVILAMVPVFLHATLLEVTESGSDTFQCVIYWPPESAPLTLNGTSGYEMLSASHNENGFSSKNASHLNGAYPESGPNQGSFNDSWTQSDDGGAVPLTNWSRRIFTIYLFTLSFLAPLAMVWIFYTMILHRLRAQKRRLFSKTSSLMEQTAAISTAAVGEEDDEGQKSSFRRKRPMLSSPAVNAASQRRSRSTRRVTIMVLSIVICYTVCWIPYWYVQITVEFFPDTVQPVFGYEVFTIISYIAYGMQSVNSMLNPFLYAFGTTQTHHRLLWTRCRQFVRLGCRWRYFGIGSPLPRGPHGSLIRSHALDRDLSSPADGGTGTCSFTLRRLERTADQNGDRLHPRRGTTRRGSGCDSKISYSVMPRGACTTKKDDHYYQAPFAYCFCCYCETKDAPAEKSKKPPPTEGARVACGKKVTMPKNRHDDDEDE